jgi:hypothetical protein
MAAFGSEGEAVWEGGNRENGVNVANGTPVDNLHHMFYK